jgi:hypothetical protein
VSEKNFMLFADSKLHRLIGLMKMEIDDEMTRAYPALQGGEVEVTDTSGKSQKIRLDNVVNATADDVRSRFRAAVAEVLGTDRAAQVEEFIDALDQKPDVGALGALLRAG